MNPTDAQPVAPADPKTEAVARHASLYQSFRASRHDSAWISDIRQAALARFVELGFPTTRDEEYRFTDVRPIADFQGTLSNGSEGSVDISQFALPVANHRLVFVDGHFRADMSAVGELPEGVVLGSLENAIAADDETVKIHLSRYASTQDNAFTALNTAFLQDGVYFYIPNGMVVETPVHVIFLANAGHVAHPRNLIVAGENSQATVVESYTSVNGGTYLTNGVTEVVAAQGANLDHYKIQRESTDAFHTHTLQVQQQRDVHFSSLNIALGGSIVRNNSNAVMGGEGIECTLNGLFVATGTQLIDNHTVMDHALPHCNSYEVYAGVLDDKARGVFNGKIFVREDAQKTDAKQTNRNLLLSREATIDTKPQLEIFADDVKCTHGATIGQLEEEAVFYLQARGIGKEDAKAILTFAFANDLVEQIRIAPLREQLSAELLQRLTHIHSN
jgi:Fe-S cluster assembly protein SufD